MSRVTIVTRAIDVAALIAEVQSNDFGAVSVFAGTVRDVNDGRSVTAINYSAYTSMAESELESIVAEAEDRFSVGAIVVEHRVGPLGIGDVSIAIVTAHAHRAPALDCTRFVIEEIKRRVPIWKREHYADGTREWIDPTASRGIATA
jgi:molybdopterin synthase catalytic subunit